MCSCESCGFLGVGHVALCRPLLVGVGVGLLLPAFVPELWEGVDL